MRMMAAAAAMTAAPPLLAAPLPANAPPSVSDPVIYIVPMGAWTYVGLVFDVGTCNAGIRDAQISFGKEAGEYAMGTMCGSAPRKFENFNLKTYGTPEEYAGRVRDIVARGDAAYSTVFRDHDDRRAQIPPRATVVNSVRVVRLASKAEHDAVLARLAAVPARGAPATAAATAAGAAAGGVSADLAAALAQSFARAPRIQLGLQTGMASVEGNRVLVNVTVQTQEYQFDVGPDARCVPAKANQLRCTYSARISAGGSFAGLRVPTQSSSWMARTDLFTKTGGQYRSASVDSWIAEIERAGNSAPPANGGDDDAKRRADKNWECRMEALREQRAALCAY